MLICSRRRFTIQENGMNDLLLNYAQGLAEYQILISACLMVSYSSRLAATSVAVSAGSRMSWPRSSPSWNRLGAIKSLPQFQVRDPGGPSMRTSNQSLVIDHEAQDRGVPCSRTATRSGRPRLTRLGAAAFASADQGSIRRNEEQARRQNPGRATACRQVSASTWQLHEFAFRRGSMAYRHQRW